MSSHFAARSRELSSWTPSQWALEEQLWRNTAVIFLGDRRSVFTCCNGQTLSSIFPFRAYAVGVFL